MPDCDYQQGVRDTLTIMRQTLAVLDTVILKTAEDALSPMSLLIKQTLEADRRLWARTIEQIDFSLIAANIETGES